MPKDETLQVTTFTNEVATKVPQSLRIKYPANDYTTLETTAVAMWERRMVSKIVVHNCKSVSKCRSVYVRYCPTYAMSITTL